MSGEAPLGFIGTGSIGLPMARRLLEAGHALVACDLRREALDPLVAAGARVAGDPAAVARACRIVFTSLPGPADVESVVTDARGLLAGARPGDVHVDLSTNSWEMVRRLHAREAQAGVQLLDAPVSGGVLGASRGTLTVMASGERAAFERVEPLLRAFAARIFHLGEVGSGTLVKLVNNALFLCAGLLVQEGFVMAAKAGLDATRLLEVLKASSGGLYAGMAETFFGRRFDDAFFQLSLAEKDVALALDSARALRVPMPVTSAAHLTYLESLARGRGQQVFFATLRTLEEAAGCQVAKLGG